MISVTEGFVMDSEEQIMGLRKKVLAIRHRVEGSKGFPNAIRSEALVLVEKYGVIKVASIAGISVPTLNNWRKKNRDCLKQEEETPLIVTRVCGESGSDQKGGLLFKFEWRSFSMEICNGRKR